MQMRVSRRTPAADGVVELTLVAADGGDLPLWQPGAHIDLVRGDGLVRQYSLCGDAADARTWRIAVLREPSGRGGSAWVHDRLRLGESVTVRGPRNHFRLEAARHYVFIAGGIGVTPVRPMVAAVDAAGAEWRLAYGGRTRASMAFVDELARYGDKVAIRPQDEVGLLDLDEVIGVPRPDTLIYCCGPEPLVRAVTSRCDRWPDPVLRVERFAPASPPADADVVDAPISVELRRTGVTVDVPVGTTVLEAVNAVGANVMSSCEEGLCGTCETEVLDGVPDHRDSVLTDAERASGTCMMLCVSRARTPRLVLDI